MGEFGGLGEESSKYRAKRNAKTLEYKRNRIGLYNSI